jgi:histidyl-tRNA synthetase
LLGRDLTYGGKGLRGAMKAADRSGARYAIVLWECDLTEDAARLKDLGSGEQRAVPLVAVTREALGR